MTTTEQRNIQIAIESGALKGRPTVFEYQGVGVKHKNCGRVTLCEWYSIHNRATWRAIDWRNGKIQNCNAWHYSPAENITDFDELAEEIRAAI